MDFLAIKEIFDTIGELALSRNISIKSLDDVVNRARATHSGASIEIFLDIVWLLLLDDSLENDIRVDLNTHFGFVQEYFFKERYAFFYPKAIANFDKHVRFHFGAKKYVTFHRYHFGCATNDYSIHGIYIFSAKKCLFKSFLNNLINITLGRNDESNGLSICNITIEYLYFISAYEYSVVVYFKNILKYCRLDQSCGFKFLLVFPCMFDSLFGFINMNALSAANIYNHIKILETKNSLHAVALASILKAFVALMLTKHENTALFLYEHLLKKKMCAKDKNVQIVLCLALKRLMQRSKFNIFEQCIYYDMVYYDKVVFLVMLIGEYIARDSVLLIEVVRLLKRILLCGYAKNSGELIERDRQKLKVMTVLHYISPTVTHLGYNSTFYGEIWQILNCLPTSCRFQMYSRWDKSLCPLKSKELVRLKTNKLLRRLSRENSKTVGKQLAKLSAMSPFDVLSLVVEQIEVYNNMIVPMVDALKYLSNFCYDVLLFTIIQKLSLQRPKLKDDGQNISTWLTALSLFCGNLGRKYSFINFEPIFHYIINSICDDQYLNLLILKELITCMTGKEIVKDLSELQVEELSSGNEIKQILGVKGEKANQKFRPKGIAQLRNILENQHTATSFVTPFLVIIAQCQQNVIYRAQSENLKLTGQLHDSCREIMILYVEFLHSAYSDVEYCNLIPDMLELSQNYFLDFLNILYIHRQVLQCNKSMFMKKLLDDNIILQCSSTNTTWKELCDIFRKIQAGHLKVPPGLYAIFWTLTLSNIYVPSERYEKEISKATKNPFFHDKNLLSQGSLDNGEHERCLHSHIVRTLKKELELHQKNIMSSRLCLNTQTKGCRKNMTDVINGDASDIVISLLQNCLLPRCVYSCADAIYSFRFILELCKQEEQLYDFIQICDELCHNLSGLLFLCTESEGSEFARFFAEILKVLDELVGQNIRSEVLNTMKHSSDENEIFRRIVKRYYGWQQEIGKSIINGLKSQDYMELRNTLIFSTKTLRYFPIIHRIGNGIVDQGESILDSDTRSDIRTVASRYHALIRHKRTNWIGDDTCISSRYKSVLDSTSVRSSTKLETHLYH